MLGWLSADWLSFIILGNIRFSELFKCACNSSAAEEEEGWLQNKLCVYVLPTNEYDERVHDFPIYAAILYELLLQSCYPVIPDAKQEDL